jgi:hypothetical protein
MSVQWTTEQVLALAPDDSSAKSGKGLAATRHWVTLGQKDNALWGECQGSGSKPYQVLIDLGEPAFKCSCPSRKFPCKHGIGLFLIYAGDAASVPTAEPPDWMAEWLKSRQAKAEKKEAAARPDSEKSPEEMAKAAADQAKRAASREKKVTQGLNDLDLWIRDLVRQGFSSLPSRPYKFWDEMAARMVDAQASGVARMVREMGGVAASGDGWQEELLERLGLLYLLIEGYRRIESLPEVNQWDVRDAVGYNVRQEELLGKPGVADLWYVAGQRIYDDDQLKVQRSYLLGLNSGKLALVLNYAPLKAQPGSTQKLDVSLVPGAVFEAELVFYPGASPLRAIIKERQPVHATMHVGTGHATFAKMLSSYADTLSGNPWLDTFPALLGNVTPVRGDNDRWYLRDSDERLLPLRSDFEGTWQLLALSGGHPLPSVFGEWNGKRLRPLSAVANDKILTF